MQMQASTLSLMTNGMSLTYRLLLLLQRVLKEPMRAVEKSDKWADQQMQPGF